MSDRIVRNIDDVRGDASQPYLGFDSLEELKRDTAIVFLAAFDIPQEYLPGEIQDGTGKPVPGNRVIARIRRLNKARENEFHTTERDRRVELYREQYSEAALIDYEPFAIGANTRARPKAIF